MSLLTFCHARLYHHTTSLVSKQCYSFILAMHVMLLCGMHVCFHAR
jgi:hypothetical protein